MPTIKTKLQAPGVEVLAPIATTGSGIALAGEGGAARVIMKGTGGAVGTFQIYGTDQAQPDSDDWYPLGPAVAFSADGSQTLFFGEPNTWYRVDVISYTAGTFSARIQREM